MNKFKPISVVNTHTFIIKASEYIEFIKELNNEEMVIERIRPTYVATNISDGLVIYARKKT